MDVDELLVHINGLDYGRELEPADLPDDDSLTAGLASLAGHPRLPALSRLVCLRAQAGDAPDTLIAATCAAVLATDAPALFGDAIAPLLACGPVLAAYGQALATALLEQAGPPAREATPRQVHRAADALEGATRLRLGQFASRFDLFTLLDAITGPQPAPWSTAAARTLVACVEAWPDGDDIVGSLERLAGTVAPRGDHDGPGTAEPTQESDFASALARVELLRALRALDRDAAVGHLDRASMLLESVRAEDDRTDLNVLAAIATLLRDLIVNAAITDPAVINELEAAVNEHRWLDPGVSHWVGDRVAAAHVAWAKLGRQLELAQARLGEPSWYDAAAVMDDIVDLYRATRSMCAFRREADEQAVAEVIAPMLETGFAARASLLHHLSAHVSYLQNRAGNGVATEQELADLPVALELAEAAAEASRRGDANPKPSAGEGGDKSSDSPAERVAIAVRRRASATRFSTGSLIANTVLEQVRASLGGCGDYITRVDVEVATDLVTGLLVSFIFDRERATASTRAYLFDQDAVEEDLARDLHDFLVGSGQLGDVRTEVRHVGGGRVDIEFAFAGFNVYAELKADSTATPLGDKVAYLRQTASYQGTDVRVGFLLVLKILKPKAVAAHLSDNVEVIEVPDSGGRARHVVALTLSGGRTAPSGM